MSFGEKVSIEEVEDALFYLSRIDAIKIEGGFLVVYNRLTLERLEQDNKKRYKAEDYQKLSQFYEDAAIDIRFPYVRYHDQDSEESGRLTNVKTQTPTASVRLTVEPGTVENGRIGMLTWAYDIKTGSLTISGEFENGQKLAVAYYDQNGRMVQVKLLTQAQTLAAVESGARIRLFLLDQDNQPVCRAMTVKR